MYVIYDKQACTNKLRDKLILGMNRSGDKDCVCIIAPIECYIY